MPRSDEATVRCAAHCSLCGNPRTDIIGHDVVGHLLYWCRGCRDLFSSEIRRDVGDPLPASVDAALTSDALGASRLIEYQWIGISAAAQRVAAEARHAVACSSPVLIIGETGVGKDLVARIIHARTHGLCPCVVLRCADTPEAILETQLLGVPPDQSRDRNVADSDANHLVAGGTIVLDEVGEASPRVHALLVRFLDGDRCHAVGPLSAATPPRIIALMRQPLIAAARTLGPDLFSRLNSLSVAIPPLRKRREDIEPLLCYFLATFSKAYHAPVPALSSTVVAQLQSYDWPGNVRELKNVAERVIVGRFGTLDNGVLATVMARATEASVPPPATHNNVPSSKRLKRSLGDAPRRR
jgi:DNA-binding NtrC family response regulator